MSDITPKKFFSTLENLLSRDSVSIALTVAVNYPTIKEWYYLVNEKERYPEDGQLQDNDKAHGEGGVRFLIGN